MAEQVRPDLALLERRQVDAVDAARQQPRQVGLAHRQRQLAQILAVADQHVEGVELDLVIVLARVQAVEIGAAVDAEQHRLAVDDERCCFGFAARPRRSADSGSVQSWPLRVNSRTRLPSRWTIRR